MCLNSKCLMFCRREEECCLRQKAQLRLHEPLQLSLQNKSPALPRKPCAHTEGTGKQVTFSKACLHVQVSSMIMLFLSPCSWDLQFTILSLTPTNKQVRGSPSMGSAGSFCRWSRQTIPFPFPKVSPFGVIFDASLGAFEEL